MTRLRYRLASALALVLASPAAGLAADIVRLGDLPSIANAGIYIAIEKGYFRERGLSVEVQRFPSARKAIAPLATGRLDVSVGVPSAELFNSIAGGMDVKIVADKGQVRPGYDFTPLIVRKDLVDSGRVKHLRDLKGMKIACATKGTPLDFFLARTMEHAGLDYDAVAVVNTSHADAVKALASKAVDAAFAPEPWGAQAEQQHIGVRYFLTEQVPSIAIFQVAVVLYGGQFIKERPTVGRAFLKAYVQGVKVYNDRGLKDPEVASILSRHLKLPVETIQAAYPVYLEPSGKPRVKDVAAFQHWFHQMGWVRENLPMSRVVDLSLLE